MAYLLENIRAHDIMINVPEVREIEETYYRPVRNADGDEVAVEETRTKKKKYIVTKILEASADGVIGRLELSDEDYKYLWETQSIFKSWCTSLADKGLGYIHVRKTGDDSVAADPAVIEARVRAELMGMASKEIEDLKAQLAALTQEDEEPAKPAAKASPSSPVKKTTRSTKK